MNIMQSEGDMSIVDERAIREKSRISFRKNLEKFEKHNQTQEHGNYSRLNVSDLKKSIKKVSGNKFAKHSTKYEHLSQPSGGSETTKVCTPVMLNYKPAEDLVRKETTDELKQDIQCQTTFLKLEESQEKCGCVTRHKQETSSPACPCERLVSLDSRLKLLETENEELKRKLKIKEEEISKLEGLVDSSVNIIKDKSCEQHQLNLAPPPPPPLPFAPPPPPTPTSQGTQTVQIRDSSTSSGTTFRNITKMKKAHWTTINPSKFSDKSLWLKIQGKKLASPELLDSLILQFSASPRNRLMQLPQNRPKESDFTKILGEVKLSLLITYRALKQKSNEAIIKSILSCEYESFTQEILDSLLLYLPPAQTLEKIRHVSVSKDDLVPVHHEFLYKLSDIDMLFPRLESMKFMIQQPEIVQDIKPKIETGIAACKNVINSGKLKTIIELILLFGNVMNSSSSTGPAQAFEMSFLLKLIEIKNVDNKSSLLHFLVDSIEKKFEDLLTFQDELIYVHPASTLSIVDVGDCLKKMAENVRKLENTLKEHTVQNVDDKFQIVMGPFAKQARKECDELSARFKELKTAYNDLADYFSWDEAVYNTEEFFKDLKTFINLFTDVHRENVRKRQEEESRKLIVEAKASTLERRTRRVKKEFKTGKYCMMADEDRLDQEATGQVSNNRRTVRRLLTANYHGTL